LTHLAGPIANYFEECGRLVNADFCLLRPELCATKLTTMNRSAAEENLRVIRELMERATIYRAVSAPAALFCGISALLVSGLALIPGPFQALFQHNFALVWVVVCLLSVTANIFFLVRATERRQERFASYRLRTALLAIAPAFIVAIAMTFYLTRAAGTELFIAVCWMALYGLALLSTTTFAPRSIVILGWAFILTSVLILCVMTPVLVLAGSDRPNLALEQVGYYAMAGSFGLYHTIYGVIVMFSARQDEHG
jgi:cytochrome bd-type quinol oxidase subunit 2